MAWGVAGAWRGCQPQSWAATCWPAAAGSRSACNRWSRIHIGLLVVEFAALLAWLGVGSASPAGSDSVQLLVSGSLAPVFWLGVVAAGLLGPVLAFVAETASRGQSSRLALAGEAGVLVGGLTLRYVVLLAAVPVLVGPAL